MNNNFIFEQGVLQVQIIRFGRSKSLEMRPGEDTSKSVVVSAGISPDSARWLVEPCCLLSFRLFATVSITDFPRLKVIIIFTFNQWKLQSWHKIAQSLVTYINDLICRHSNSRELKHARF